MSSPKSMITRKAAKAVAAHSAHGTISKARRRPVRTVTLLGVGTALGTAIGFLLGSRRTSSPTPSAPAPAPTAVTVPPTAAPVPPAVGSSA